MVANVVMILSVQLYCLTAAMMPIGTLKMIVTMSAVLISRRVAGRRSMTLARTGRPSMNEKPQASGRQIWTKAVIQLTYCSRTGLSRPYRRMSASICSGGTRGTRKRSTGLPGASWTMPKIRMEIPNRIGMAWMIRRIT